MSKDQATYPAESSGGNSVLDRVLNRLLSPVARLCLRHGITFAAAAEKLKLAFVHEAGALNPETAEHGMVSRISTATGINRREVTRLTKTTTPKRITKQPLAAEVVALWTTSPLYTDADGAPRPLRRQGAESSFETLAYKVTRDVHPRSILEELERLGLIRYDEKLDSVLLVRADFVPDRDAGQMLGLLGDNVGDHLDAAVENVADNGANHLEQAVFADELSTESLAALRPMIVAHWQKLRKGLVPVIADLIEADKHAGRPQDQRIRIGLYSYAEGDAGQPAPVRTPRPRRLRTVSSKEHQE